MKENTEKRFPLAIAFCALALLWWVTSKPPDAVKDLYQITANIAGIFIGFLMTAKAIIFSFKENFALDLIKKRKKHSILLSYFLSPICLFTAVLFVSLLGIVFNNGNLGLILFYSWVFLFTWAMGACLRFILVFSVILKSSGSADK